MEKQNEKKVPRSRCTYVYIRAATPRCALKLKVINPIFRSSSHNIYNIPGEVGEGSLKAGNRK